MICKCLGFKGQDLYQSIFNNYNTDIPAMKGMVFIVTNNSSSERFSTLKDSVDDGFTPYDISVDIEWIVDVKGESSQWTILMWLGLTWFDNRLAWNASQYNISKISLPGNVLMVFSTSKMEK